MQLHMPITLLAVVILQCTETMRALSDYLLDTHLLELGQAQCRVGIHDIQQMVRDASPFARRGLGSDATPVDPLVAGRRGVGAACG